MNLKKLRKDMVARLYAKGALDKKAEEDKFGESEEEEESEK
jgi:hypothetical protein